MSVSGKMIDSNPYVRLMYSCSNCGAIKHALFDEYTTDCESATIICEECAEDTYTLDEMVACFDHYVVVISDGIARFAEGTGCNIYGH